MLFEGAAEQSAKLSVFKISTRMCCVSASFLHYLKTFSRWITDLTCTYTHCRPTAGYKHATDVCTLMKSVYKKGFSSCGLDTKCNKFFQFRHMLSAIPPLCCSCLLLLTGWHFSGQSTHCTLISALHEITLMVLRVTPAHSLCGPKKSCGGGAYAANNYLWLS